LKFIINKILAYFKLAIINPANWRPKFEHESVFLPPTLSKIIFENSMLTEIKMANIKQVIEYVVSNKIEGCYVECGVWKGGSAAFAAHILIENNHKVNLHLFDAFDDICEPDAEIDGPRAIRDVGGLQNATGRLQPVTGIYQAMGGAGNETMVHNLIANEVGYPSESIKLHKGWFQDTLPPLKNDFEKIAILRLDGDWYASTKVCLDNLYQHVVKGGIIIIDDYGCYEGCKKAVDEFLEKNRLLFFLHKVDNECVFFVKL
jgi:hypothetical protein